MYQLEDNFVLKLVSLNIRLFAEQSVSAAEFEEFLSNLPIPLINSLSDRDKHTLGYYFNSYSYEVYSQDFYNSYSFVSEFETKYSLFK